MGHLMELCNGLKMGGHSRNSSSFVSSCLRVPILPPQRVLFGTRSREDAKKRGRSFLGTRPMGTPTEYSTGPTTRCHPEILLPSWLRVFVCQISRLNLFYLAREAAKARRGEVDPFWVLGQWVPPRSTARDRRPAVIRKSCFLRVFVSSCANLPASPDSRGQNRPEPAVMPPSIARAEPVTKELSSLAR
jgi:hypothetical protein